MAPRRSKAGKVQALPPVSPEILAQAEEMLGNTDVSRSRALKQALLSEARQGGEKPRGGKASAGKGQSRPAKGAPFGAGGQDPAPKDRDGKPGSGKPKKAKPASKPGKPSKHRKGPPKPKAAGGSKTKVKP